jgi:hypothetical protein
MLAIDWSGASRGEGRALWLAEGRGGFVTRLEGGRTRDEVVALLLEEAERDRRLVVGLDFAFGLPEWYARSRGAASAVEVWKLVAREGESWLRDPQPPFWRAKNPRLGHAELRRTELEVAATGIRPKSVFQLGGAGQVGTSSLRGMPYLLVLAERFAVWPFERPRLPLVVEIYPRLFRTVAPPAPNEHARDAAASAVALSSWTGDWTELPLDPACALEGRIWCPGPQLDSDP